MLDDGRQQAEYESLNEMPQAEVGLPVPASLNTGSGLPQNIEAEKAVLGAVLLDNDALIEVQSIVEADDFSKNAHRVLFTAMKQLFEDDLGIDPITLAEYLENKQQIDNVGGISYIMELAVGTPTAENAEYYATIVKDKSTARRFIQMNQQLMNRALKQDLEIDDLIDLAEGDILQIAEQRERQDIQKIKTVVDRVLEELQIRSEQKGDVTGLATGYPDLDRMTTGLHPDELIILAARPGVGKTAFALNIAGNIATSSNQAVAIFSLEMGAEALVSRMISAIGGIDSYALRTGDMSQEDWGRFYNAMGILAGTNIYIDDTPGIKVNEIRAKCRKIEQESHGELGIVIIDYLQLIEGSGKGRENRQQEVSEISRQLKKLAKELHVPIIALSQLSRGVEQRQDKRPVLSDIRESGSIEQDADIVAFLYRDDYYEREGQAEDETDDQMPQNQNQPVEVIIEKNRSGSRGTVSLFFVKEHQKFRSMTLREEE